MAHSISRTTAPIPAVGDRDAGPLSLEDTTRTESDIVMTRADRWVTCRSGITDPNEVAQELEWFAGGNPSGSVTYRVLERTLILRERLLDASPNPPPPPGTSLTCEQAAAAATTGPESTAPSMGATPVPRVTAHVYDPVTVRCPSCRAAPGRPCKTSAGRLAAQPHRARGDAAQQLYFDDVAQARQRGITVEQLREYRAALRAAARR